MAAAEIILPFFISFCKFMKFSLASSRLSVPMCSLSVLMIPIFPLPLNSGLIIFFASTVFTAKEISVGGTFISSKVPLMESFPPIGGASKNLDAVKAPRSDLSGFDQAFLLSIFS